MPDAFETQVREIFPDDHPGSFVPRRDGRWVWATLHTFEWDLNYSNPEVFRAVAGGMLFLANQGVDILRMDAVAFYLETAGNACENLPEAHVLPRPSTPFAGSPHPPCCSSPRPSCTPTKWRSTSTRPNASSPAAPCGWPSPGKPWPPGMFPSWRPGAPAQHPGGNVLGELGPQPRRHRLDLCRRGLEAGWGGSTTTITPLRTATPQTAGGSTGRISPPTGMPRAVTPPPPKARCLPGSGP